MTAAMVDERPPTLQGDEPEAYAAALAGLPGMGPARLAAVLAGSSPAEAWGRVRAGARWSDPVVLQALGPRGEEVVARWRAVAAGTDLVALAGALAAAGMGVVLAGTAGYPPALAGDVEPPPVLFHQGPLRLIAGPRVAIVGTRRCSTTGAGMAFELGRDLAAAGVAVVSGLASGIDGAAHRGVLAAGAPADRGAPAAVRAAVPGGAPARGAAQASRADSAHGGGEASAVVSAVGGEASGATSAAGDGAARPIGVVGSGLDVVYPAVNRRLWTAVATSGLLLSEAPLGARPERWRFPARNRIIAALADLVVVVESHRRGGSLHTVDEADRRAIDVMAVPGSVRNPAAAGTNELLAEGRAPVCSVDDVLVALGLGAGAAGRAGPGLDRRPPPHPADRAVLEAVGWQPATLDQLVLRAGLDLARLAPALDRLVEAGWVARRGGWYERVPIGTRHDDRQEVGT